jgi:Fur family zinc uptake transcriptional regulator
MKKEGLAALTRLRSLVLDILVAAGEPIKAYDILEIVRQKGQRLTPSTIYRILEFLERHDLVHRVNSLSAYVACRAESETECYPFIVVCSNCQKTTEINDQELYKSIFRRLDDMGLGFSPGSVEIQGLCPQCAGH